MLTKNSDRMRRWSRHSGDGIFVATAMSLLALGTDVLTQNTVAQESVLANTLRFSAQTRGFLIGAAVAAQPLKNEGTYSQALAREFNIIVPENAMKFDHCVQAARNSALPTRMQSLISPERMR